MSAARPGYSFGVRLRHALARLSRTMRHNWQLKLLAFMLTLVLSVYVRTQREQTMVNQVLLPFMLTPRPGQRVVRPGPEFRVRVTIDGPSELVRELIDLSELQLTFNEELVRTGKTTRIPLSVDYPDRYKNRVNVAWTPREVDVQVVSDTVRRFPVLVRPANKLEGWEFPTLPTAEPSQVTVSGPAAAVESVAEVVAAFRVERSQRISQPVTLRALNPEGREVDGTVRLDPAQVIVRGTQEEVVLQKRIPIQPLLVVPPGMRVTSVRVSPAQVRIVGPTREVSSVYLAETEAIQVAAGETTVSRDVSVAPPKPGLDVVPTRVHVDLTLQPPASRPRRPQ